MLLGSYSFSNYFQLQALGEDNDYLSDKREALKVIGGGGLNKALGRQGAVAGRVREYVRSGFVGFLSGTKGSICRELI